MFLAVEMSQIKNLCVSPSPIIFVQYLLKMEDRLCQLIRDHKIFCAKTFSLPFCSALLAQLCFSFRIRKT